MNTGGSGRRAPDDGGASTARRQAVRTATTLLAEGAYEVLEVMTRGRRLSADEMRSAVHEYGATLVPLPEPALDELDVVQVTGSALPTFDVVVDLWSYEEGRSDLSLELRLTDRFDGAHDVEILDIHTL